MLLHHLFQLSGIGIFHIILPFGGKKTFQIIYIRRCGLFRLIDIDQNLRMAVFSKGMPGVFEFHTRDLTHLSGKHEHHHVSLLADKSVIFILVSLTGNGFRKILKRLGHNDSPLVLQPVAYGTADHPFIFKVLRTGHKNFQYWFHHHLFVYDFIILHAKVVKGECKDKRKRSFQV